MFSFDFRHSESSRPIIGSILLATPVFIGPAPWPADFAALTRESVPSRRQLRCILMTAAIVGLGHRSIEKRQLSSQASKSIATNGNE